MKTCRKCGASKPLGMFHRMTASSDGHHTQCKACKTSYAALWYAANRDVQLAKQRVYRKANPGRMQQWREANPDYYRDRERRLAEDPDYRKSRAQRRAAYYKRLRAAVLQKLGGCCCKCGFKDPRALQIDHIEGGGNQELGSIPRTQYLRKVISEAPGVYQLLCANCNWIKRWENGEHRSPTRDL